MDNIKSNPKKVFKFVGLLQTLKIIPNKSSLNFSNIKELLIAKLGVFLKH